eukprot:2133188-Pyramimonas_sp.AAC.1
MSINECTLVLRTAGERVRSSLRSVRLAGKDTGLSSLPMPVAPYVKRIKCNTSTLGGFCESTEASVEVSMLSVEVRREPQSTRPSLYSIAHLAKARRAIGVAVSRHVALSFRLASLAATFL